jgi:hypothetical protein
MENFAFVPETRFGIWFLGSRTWLERVLEVAVADLTRLLGNEARQSYDVVLDVGCGQGKSFSILSRRFNHCSFMARRRREPEPMPKYRPHPSPPTAVPLHGRL